MNYNIQNDLSTLLNQMAHLRRDVDALRKSLNKERNLPTDRYTIKEVAEIAGCSTETIKNHVRAGFLKVRYPMAKRRFDAKDVEQYLRGKG
ncbi:helix-turn-helix domain-containing protein [Candidatus Uabimicrobium amorphum]|uniref:Helix-turn-helix domain-containing protein n=1 Tax=Uabimicrobium amorphum TaxID=2596890 RepID=A0A5S9IRK9_UABAM|nr:helix-turn-helix domain-containing protein [Candidatus Uabimicrobium amorphum]BBM86838.1 hypothetical protein UABAM_05235 [Candidatus Uabimicrobium amorphum]